MHLGNKAEETNRTGHHTEVGALKNRTGLLSFLTSADGHLGFIFYLAFVFFRGRPFDQLGSNERAHLWSGQYSHR
jgi:hypothetical protein